MNYFMQKHVSQAELERYSEDRKADVDTTNYVDFKKFVKYISILPLVEQDIITLYKKVGKTQRQIALMLGFSQGGISFRIRKIMDRLEYLHRVPKFTQLDHIFIRGTFDQLDQDVIYCMHKTTSQTDTAKFINDKYNLCHYMFDMTQMRVYCRIQKIRGRLESMHGSYQAKKLLRILDFIATNKNIMSEIKLGQHTRTHPEKVDLR